MVPLARAFAQVLARKAPLAVRRSWFKRLQLRRARRKHVAVGCKELALLSRFLFVVLAKGVIENLYLNAVRQAFVMLTLVKILDRLFTGPHEDARIAARFLMHPLHDQLKIG